MVWAPIYDPTSSATWNTYGISYMTSTVYVMTICTVCASIITGRISKLISEQLMYSSVSYLFIYLFIQHIYI